MLDAQTNPLVVSIRPDPADRRAIRYEREIFIQKCPMCGERMSHVNFGGRSGVDRCGMMVSG